MAGTQIAEVHWTPREREVLDLIARGRTNGEIAEELGITFGTAKWHVSEVISKLGVDSREEVAAYWRRERSLTRRTARVGARVAAVPVLLKAAAAVAVIGVVTGGIAVGLLATNGDDATPQAVGTGMTATPVATSTPTPTETQGVTVTATSTPIPSPTATPTPMERQWYPWQPVGVRTGDPQVDRILAAIDDLDADALVSLTSYEEYPCEGPKPQQPQPRRCPEGVAEGTILQGFPVAEVEGAYLRPGDMHEFWEIWSARWYSTLYGVFTRLDDVGRRETLLLFARPAVEPHYFDEVRVRNGLAVAATWRYTQVPDDALFAPDAGGWLLPPVPVVPPAVTSFARGIEARLKAGNLDAIITEGEPTAYRCTGDGHVEGAEYSDLCESAQAGETREGFPITLHGSHGGPRRPDELAEELLSYSPERRWELASIGCAVRDWDCASFLVAFGWGDGTVSRAMYLEFRQRPEGSPVLVAAGLSGDNVLQILHSFVTTTRLGLTHFYQVAP